MDWRLATGGHKRTINNALSGVKLTGLGRAVGFGASAGMIGGAVMQNKYGKPTISNVQPGISQAESMSYDLRQNTALGTSGDLTLALSKYGFETR